MNEAERRRRLRWHRETGIDSEDDAESIELRDALDGELIELTNLELRAETAHGDVREALVQQIRGARALTQLVRKSPAFAQYLNAYFYFGIRFAVGREHAPAHRDENRWNERPIGLPTPPDCIGIAQDEMQREVDRFLSIPLTEQESLALEFLDGFTREPGELCTVKPDKMSLPSASESSLFELWLRGLLPNPPDPRRFDSLAEGLLSWANARHDYYCVLERRKGRERSVDLWQEGQTTVEGQWIARNPLAARCGVADFYWLAQILCAEVTPRGVVTYKRRSWLYYLAFLKPDARSRDRILRIEEVLRSVFDFACELIQNAVEIAESRENRRVDPPPTRPWTADWRATYDREIGEVANQRIERLYKDEPGVTRVTAPAGAGAGEYWSWRIRSGEHEENLVGLALSGGGIRSATFALGVLQALKDLDWLRQVDFLSTVSGGGYIGAWLLGNVRRTHYWLSRMTSWDESIGYLRRYSKYLAPQTGVLSADSWVIWGTWLRNVLLIQLNAFSWLASLFVGTIGLKVVFDNLAGKWIPSPYVAGLLALILAGLSGILFLNLWDPVLRRKTQHRTAVVLAWIGSFLTAVLLWQETTNRQIPCDFSVILTSEIRGWPWYLSTALVFCLFLLAVCSIWRQKPAEPSKSALAKFVGSLVIALVTSGVAYIAICGAVYLFQWWASWGKDLSGWYAYVFGPAMVLLAVTLAIVIFIGLVGRDSADWRREWWTRFGSWLAIFGAGFLAVAVAAVFSPVWVYRLYHYPHASVPWAAVAGWAGSVISGLLAGNSSKTKGNGADASKGLELAAKIGGLVFIVGAVLGVSTLVHVLLVKVWVDHPSDWNCWWKNFNSFLEKSCSLLPLFGNFGALLVTLAVLVICGLLFSWRFNINTFGLNQFYRNRLVRCYLGGTRWIPGLRHPEVFTGFDDADDLDLTKLQFATQVDGEHFRGPFPIVNCSLNLGGSSDLSVHTRQSASFVLTPLHAGSDRQKVGYVPIRKEDGLRKEDGFGDNVTLGQAISISGAAASPNMGYNTSALAAVLLTMFNVRLAWWFPNPGRKKWKKDSPVFSLGYLILEFLGLADENSNFVNVSDGGHFENLGIYELVRRRAKVIIASDAECDPELGFGSLGNVIRICETDFGAKIDIDVSSIRKQAETGVSRAHCAVGRITYSNGSLGYLIYLKASIAGDEEADIQQYRVIHPDFPHQSTGDQFFTEDQFESYRRLGQHIARVALRAGADEPDIVALAAKLFDVWAPAGFSSGTFLTQTKSLDKLWETFRKSPKLTQLHQELLADKPAPLRPGAPSKEEMYACLELIQLMEDVFLDLRLDSFWEHPDNRGWAVLFTRWARSPTLRAVWEMERSSFGIRFEYFCAEHLGLEAEHPVRRG